MAHGGCMEKLDKFLLQAYVYCFIIGSLIKIFLDNYWVILIGSFLFIIFSVRMVFNEEKSYLKVLGGVLALFCAWMVYELVLPRI